MKKISIFFLIVGIFLRLVWIYDMEYKADEQWSFEHAQEIVHTNQWPLFGMPNSLGFSNPGASLWVFALPSFFLDTPTALTRYVQCLNICALLMLFIFALKCLESKERDIWFACLSLAAISPASVIFSRKIWAQDVLPFFVAVIIISHYFRKDWRGGLLWGVIGALLGQIHMSGFFFSLAITALTLFSELIQKKRITCWWAWLTGSVIGTIPLLPWIKYYLAIDHQGDFALTHLYRLDFYHEWYLFISGTNIEFFTGHSFDEFFSITYNKGAYYLIWILLIFTLLIGIKKLILNIKAREQTFHISVLLNDYVWFYIFAISLIFVPVLSMTGVTAWIHYFIVTSPLLYLPLAVILYDHRKILLLLLSCQLLVTISFLNFVHHKGVIDGDYGTVYRLQQ